jgi:hypothetical protein
MLRHLFANDPERYRQSLVRAAGFYNANPYLAPAALGAELRAEVDGVPPGQIDRLRTALSGPLGSLGDRLFWTGLVPALVSAVLVAVALGAGPWPVLAFVVVHNVVRGALARWLLDLGWRHGLRVGSALNASPLVHASALAGQAAAFVGAAALPVVGLWLLAGARERDLARRGGGDGRGPGPPAAAGAPGVRPAAYAGRGTRGHSLAMGDGVIERTVTVTNSLGLHARPAAQLVRTASGFHRPTSRSGGTRSWSMPRASWA